DTVQVVVSEDRGRRAGFHVGHAAAVDLAISDRPAPRTVRPGLILLIGREHVHVAVEYQMATGSRRREGSYDVRHSGLGRDDAEGQLVRFQEARDVRGGECRVAGWVRTLGADEFAQKTNDLVAVLVDPPHELLFEIVHGVLSSSVWRDATASAMGRKPAAARGAVRRLHRLRRSAGEGPPYPARPEIPGKRAIRVLEWWWACRRRPPRSVYRPD